MFIYEIVHGRLKRAGNKTVQSPHGTKLQMETVIYSKVSVDSRQLFVPFNDILYSIYGRVRWQSFQGGVQFLPRSKQGYHFHHSQTATPCFATLPSISPMFIKCLCAVARFLRPTFRTR